MARISAIYVASIAFHVGLATWVGSIEKSKSHAAIAISVQDTVKKAAAAKIDEPAKKPDPAPEKPVQKTQAKAAPKAPNVNTPPPAPQDAPSPASDNVPDFGLALSGEVTGGGLAVPPSSPKADSPHPAAPPKPKVLKAMPEQDVCDEPLVKAKPVTVPTPVYPERAREKQIEGKVRVELTVDAEGDVKSTRVIAGLGDGLDEAALEAARAARFEPATRCGKKVASTFVIAMRFAL